MLFCDEAFINAIARLGGCFVGDDAEFDAALLGIIESSRD